MPLYAFDGTWNEAKDGDDPDYTNSNVARFYKAYQSRSPRPDRDVYLAGVGTRLGGVGRALGGVFGLGSHTRLNEAYEHLCKAWDEGERDIDIVGFSRGAATTLDFCHCIQERGIRRPGTKDVVEAEPRIRFLGVWDVVAAFGLANLGNTALNIGHHLSLPRKQLQYCFHALALDEPRPSFLPTRLEGACEVWFRGVHSDVGGGNTNRGLNDVTLRWMMRKAIAAGLPIAEDDVDALKPDPTAAPGISHRVPVKVRTVSSTDRGHYTVGSRPGWAALPATCSIETEADEGTAAEIGANGLEVLPLAVRRRVLAMWEAAEAIAERDGITIDESAKDVLLTLFQGRISLVSTEDDLHRARRGAAQIAANAIRGARRRGEHRLSGFYVNEALFTTKHLYPVTD
jgi:hypothetical protein